MLNASRIPWSTVVVLGRFWLVTICAGLFAVLAAEPAATAGPRPNVVLMMADDLGWGDIGYQGHATLKTPELDALAAAGLRFDRFYAAAPVCSPTRGSCLTGRHPFRYGIFFANQGHLPAEELSLANILRQQGYATGHFGKWHLGTLTQTERDANRGGQQGAAHFAPPWLRGFDVCFSTESKVPTFDPLWQPRGNRSGLWWDPVPDASQAQPYGTAYWTPSGRVAEPLPGDDSQVIMDRALPFIEACAQRQQPFLAVIWFHAPHLPVVAGPHHTAPYQAFDKYTQHYYGCIAALDEQVGRLRRHLREHNLADNTMLWFCSDNGPEGQSGKAPGTAAQLRGRKRDLYEGGIRVPGLLEWPGTVPAGSVTTTPASTSDFLPTTLDVLGLTLPDDRPLDGVSLRPVWETAAAPPRRAPLGFESERQVAWIDGDWKLVGRATTGLARHAADTDFRYELFHLGDDPGEQTDRAADEPQRTAAMVAALQAWRGSCRRSLAGDDYPTR